ncbi:MAG: hypothetical protein AAF748_04315 [Pseudomonadota bacterium]
MADGPAIVAEMVPSPGRRWLALIVLTLLGVILISVGVSARFPSFVMSLTLIAMGLAALALAVRLYNATSTRLILTDEGIRDGNDRILCRIDEIAAVDRSAFAFKPSNGFMVLLKSKKARAWEPGLWWRIGRRIGVGGVTPSGQSRLMADLISLYLREGTFRPGAEP